MDALYAASGGAKWLVLAGLDRYLFGEWLQREPRTRPLPAIGSSIGSWRLACAAQTDPVAALDRGHDGYIFGQEYSAAPDAREISTVSAALLDRLLGQTGASAVLAHPFLRLHIVTARGRGLTATTNRRVLQAGLAIAATANAVTRRTLGWHFTRTIFSAQPASSPFRTLHDLPTEHRVLTAAALRDVLLASGSIPLVMEGVRLPMWPTEVHWDGGVTDYHLDLDPPAGDGLVLYPHFYPYIVPGWFDKALPWRRAHGPQLARTLLIAPSDAFVASLPGGKIPDRRDFASLSHTVREQRWQAVRERTAELGDELRALITSGDIAAHVEPLPDGA